MCLALLTCMIERNARSHHYSRASLATPYQLFVAKDPMNTSKISSESCGKEDSSVSARARCGFEQQDLVQLVGLVCPDFSEDIIGWVSNTRMTQVQEIHPLDSLHSIYRNPLTVALSVPRSSNNFNTLYRSGWSRPDAPPQHRRCVHHSNFTKGRWCVVRQFWHHKPPGRPLHIAVEYLRLYRWI